MRKVLLFGWMCAILCGWAAIGIAAEESGDSAELEASLRATEQAFAKTMADRDHSAFTSFLDEETVFFSGSKQARGADAVAEAWAPFFESPDAPFSWAPEAVAVLDSGHLGLSTGPIFDPSGERIGTFNSVWRKADDGTWKIVFDRGCPPCEESR